MRADNQNNAFNFENLSIIELETLLTNDLKDPMLSADEILHISQILAQRKHIKTDVTSAWSRFLKYYYYDEG